MACQALGRGLRDLKKVIQTGEIRAAINRDAVVSRDAHFLYKSTCTSSLQCFILLYEYSYNIFARSKNKKQKYCIMCHREAQGDRSVAML